MITFRCKLSGVFHTFETEYDIKQMRRHPEYEEVKEPKAEEKPVDKKVTKNSKEG